MKNVYKLYADNECVETVTFDDESGTCMTNNPNSAVLDIRTAGHSQSYQETKRQQNCEDSPKNCPNCGAPIIGNSCEYCGTIFVDRKASEIEKANQLYSDAIARLNMYKLNQQACDLRTAMMQARMATQNANLVCQLGYGTQGMRWTNAMAQQTPPDELEKFERQNMLAATNVYPYHQEPDSTKKRKEQSLIF